MEKLEYACTVREAKIVNLYKKGLTLEKIGKKLALSSSRVKAIIDQAMARIEEVTDEELKLARDQHPIMRVPALDTTKTRLIRCILWDNRLRTLEQIANAGYSTLRNVGLSEKSILTIAKILKAYNLILKGWQEKEENEARIAQIAEEFRNWWNTTKTKVPSTTLPEVRRAIRRILYS
jgi:DNA-binding CsgD family transcriptional regulator